MRFNLSEAALRHRSLVVYAMLVLAIAGAMSYFKLGRSEDPEFTFKVMVIHTLWPGATAEQVGRQVTDRIEQKLMETGEYDFIPFLSPALQKPIAFGADVVLHSTTKYINGHSDVVGGAVVAATPELHERFTWWANALGITGSPFDSFLTLRGLRTLDARLRVHQENAQAIAAQLDAHPAVAKVHYPGLASHPGHAVAARQQNGFGAMLSLELDGGVDAVRAFVDGLRHFTLAESLGGVESLVAHPASMTHAAMTAEARAAAGIPDGLVRLSIGIEACEDLQADLAAALDRALAQTRPGAAGLRVDA